MKGFSNRHIGINSSDKKQMLDCLKVDSIEQLISETIPSNIRLKNEMDLDPDLLNIQYFLLFLVAISRGVKYLISP